MGFIWKKCSVNRYKFKYPYRYDGLNIPRGMRERWSTRNNRIAFCLLTFWSIFEFGLCLGILLSKESNKHDYPENFLNGICTKSCETPSNKNCKHSCERFISYGLIARCVTSITLFIGIFVVSDLRVLFQKEKAEILIKILLLFIFRIRSFWWCHGFLIMQSEYFLSGQWLYQLSPIVSYFIHFFFIFPWKSGNKLI